MSPPSWKRTLKDPSTLVLLGSNVITLVLAWVEQWSFATVICTYWMQSVIIGIFNFMRMWSLHRFSTEGLLAGGEPIPENEEGKKSTALFFLLHYGFFHLIYATILFGNMDGIRMRDFFIGSSIFFVNHLFSFLHYRQEDKIKVAHLGSIMARPYLRIFPIHLTIGFFAAFVEGSLGLLVFLIMKMIADILAHVFEHTRPQRA